MSLVTQHAQRVRDAVAAGDAARSVLIASWQRSLELHGLDPASTAQVQVHTGAEIAARGAALGDILFAADARLDGFWAGLRGTRACLAISDADGIVLRLIAPDADRQELRDNGLRLGSDWNEAQLGTNGIGTCLADRQARFIHLDQHFRAQDDGISCIALPFHDHLGQLAGAVNLTFYGRAAARVPAGLFLAPMRELAFQIETDHFHRSFAPGRIVALSGHPRPGAALVAVDRDGVVLGANRAARQVCGLNDAGIRAGILLDALEGGEGQRDGLVDAERGSLRRALLRSRGNVSAAARDLGISRATMKRKLRDHGLSPRRPEGD